MGTNSFIGAAGCFPDFDGDSIADASDWDDDNDGIPDGIDADPLSAATAIEITLPLNATQQGAKLLNSMRR